MHNFKELKIWKKSRTLVLEVYKITKQFPASEKFNLTSQMCRSAVSIPSNISEGAGRRTKADFKRFLDIARGSAFELETQLILALDLRFISTEDFNDVNEKLIEVQKMLHMFILSIKT